MGLNCTDEAEAEKTAMAFSTLFGFAYKPGNSSIFAGSAVECMKDLAAGMVLTGTVRNVIDFGAFIDIGVHQDGLVHVSEIANKFIRHPSEILSVGDVVKVIVLAVDPQKKRISLSIKQVKQ